MLKNNMTAAGLISEIQKMTQPRPAAIIFGLEMGWSLERVIFFTWGQAKDCQSTLTPLARQILSRQLRHISLQYVFWFNSRGDCMPVYGLCWEIFEEFGLLWGELLLIYRSPEVCINAV
ncbi:hypothetical protein [Ferrovum sp.]|uniref:hypothetical protein n=1 Tax=Ferrovum sp. TaxID=2609467 RepID=UPI0026078517|nr:hypothetical protein [Ferrovum sp.]